MKGKFFLSMLVILLGLAVSIPLFAADAIVGTWKMNVEKSKFDPGPAPKSSTVTYEETANGIKRTGETIEADGKKTSFTYTAKYDGKDYPVTGSPLFDSIAVKSVNEHTAEATLKKAGKVVRHAKREISHDGKTMKIIMTGEDNGKKIHNIGVYDKQ
ncbi:MAG: hypothetical protein U0V70_07690 [Terriglobia bacterium]